MVETSICLWTDHAEHTYVLLRGRGVHWNVEWGYRNPPGSDFTFSTASIRHV